MSEKCLTQFKNWVARPVIKHLFFIVYIIGNSSFQMKQKQWAQKSKRAKNENWKGKAFWVANLSMSRIIMSFYLSYTNYSTQWVWQDTTKKFQVYKVMSKRKNKKTEIWKNVGDNELTCNLGSNSLPTISITRTPYAFIISTNYLYWWMF
jgi:hypothetical protein